MTPTRQILLLLVLCVAAAAIFSLGLRGPFLFDDYWVMTPIQKWHEGAFSWRQAMFPVGLFESRPLSTASLMLTTALGGPTAFPGKLGNVIIHLACGACVYWLLRTLFRLDKRLHAHAELLALGATAIWMLHPLHVSTVLYVVQRMSQLSALFTLAAVLCYMLARQRLEAERDWRSVGVLFGLFPLFVAVGMLAKQNTAVVPLVCAVLELAYFQRRQPHVRQTLTIWYSGFLLAPSMMAIAILIVAPDLLMGGYQQWDFTPAQRLLTQPRVLLDYAGTILVPYTPRMGLYTDDVIVSTGLLQPATTLGAILGLLLLSLVMWMLRKRSPTAFAGWFLFLAGHAVEASFLPIEMYYEHRNYLPSVGIVMLVIGLASLLPPTPRLHRILRWGFALFLGVLVVATLGRVLVWQSHESIIEQGYRQHPMSMRAASDMISLSLDRGQPQVALGAAEALSASEDPRARIYAGLYRVALECRAGGVFNQALLDQVVSERPTRLTVYEAQMLKFLDNSANFGQCPGHHGNVADAFRQLLDSAVAQSEGLSSKYVLREHIGRLYAAEGRFEEALAQADLAWRQGHNPPAGAMLMRLQLLTGDRAGARLTMESLRNRIDRGDKAGQEELLALQRMLDAAAMDGSTQ